jgi:putative nucleotidyltransferase with HDIG domain
MSSDNKTVRLDQALFQQTLEKKLADLPPLPAVVTRILQTVNDPRISAEELSRLISLDQGLSSKILRIVNSAYYGFPKRISTVTHAVVILGFNTVRNLVLGVSAFGMLTQKSGSSGLDRTKFWEHCVAVAVASSVMAKKRRPVNRSVSEEAFIAGLLHDIGKLFLDCYFPVQYAVTLLFGQREALSVLASEQRVLEIDHAAVGRRIAEHWNFPPLLASAIGGHHEPVSGSEHFESTALIHAADWIVWQAGCGGMQTEVMPELAGSVEEWLGFTAEDYDWVQLQWRRQYDAAHDILRLH